MIKRRIGFFAVPLGFNLNAENLHGLIERHRRPAHARRRRQGQARRSRPSVSRKVSPAPCFTIRDLELPAEVTEFFPQVTPPLRSDNPTLRRGPHEAGQVVPLQRVGPGRRRRQGQGPEFLRERARSGAGQLLPEQHDQPVGEGAHAAGSCCGPIAPWCSLYEQSKLQRQDLLASAQIAVEKNELDGRATACSSRCVSPAPHDLEAKAGLKIVKNMQDGKLTREMIREQMKKEKGDRLEKVNGVLQWKKGQLLHLRPAATTRSRRRSREKCPRLASSKPGGNAFGRP